MIFYRALVIASAVGLAACQTTKPIAMSVSYQPTSPTATHGDVLAEARAQGQNIPQLRGTEFITVRSYHYTLHKDSGTGVKEEMTDAECKLESDSYTASFRTPAQVKVPNYGYASRPVSVRCDAPGYKTGFANAGAENETRKKIYRSGSGAGLVGLMTAAIIDAANSEDNDDFKYPLVSVVMNREDCDSSTLGCRAQ
ncbi:hypothetical protein [Stappia sp. WLB 29]|uniref:hypothetical protein n=1 Tax=Stappia sp. WLB 29 TaxID=2925220 RepID=UPI0020BFD7CD|nr:hypothetical protein [Stappia sp. WLB 29]